MTRYMHTNTGSVDTEENWRREAQESTGDEKWDFDQTVKEGHLVEVEMTTKGSAK